MDVSYELRARMALEKNGFRNAHSLGQNFIFDESLMRMLLAQAELSSDDHVLEIGPGPGILTALLADGCAAVTAIEIDEKLRPVLEDMLAGKRNVNIIFGDVMRLDLASVAAGCMGEAPFRVVANLPYYITTDVLLRLVTSRLPITDICVMVQKEAAERIMSRPGTKSWCAMAAIISYFATTQLLCEVPRTAFDPPPHVDSAFIRIAPYTQKPVQAQSDAAMCRLINAAFHMRRKKLTNNLKAVYGIDQNAAAALVELAGIDRDARGEALDMAQLARLSDCLSAQGK